MHTLNEFVKRSITGIIFASVLVVTFLYFPPATFTLLLFIILGEILFFEWPRLTHHNNKLWALTPLYPILPFCLLMYINQHSNGRSLIPILFATAWSNDIGAYYTGKLLGKNKLASQISPRKTWEGFLGGIIFCIITLAILFLYNKVPFRYSLLSLISIILCSLATIGDLFESWLKRKAGIKDTGSLLPGHGGFLDRFDSTLFVTIPFFIYCFFWLNS